VTVTRVSVIIIIIIVMHRSALTVTEDTLTRSESRSVISLCVLQLERVRFRFRIPVSRVSRKSRITGHYEIKFLLSLTTPCRRLRALASGKCGILAIRRARRGRFHRPPVDVVVVFVAADAGLAASPVPRRRRDRKPAFRSKDQHAANDPRRPLSLSCP
jgi:hypothetical protein